MCNQNETLGSQTIIVIDKFNSMQFYNLKKMAILLRIFLLALIQVSAADSLCNVTIEQGTLIGQMLESVTGEGKYCSFKGIPYAQPPIGNLRFKAPLPALPWEGVRNATEHGPKCPQINSLTEEYIPGNESCLHLNIYVKNITTNQSCSVLVFIHGGLFKFDSGDIDLYGPDFFLADDSDIVVVTINYRLDALGFLCLGTEDVPGNAGLKDQVMALKWVQKNIQYFGGDPNKVTIMGESAGAASVGFHMISPMSSGLFQRAIAMSGSPYNDCVLPYQPEARALIFAKNLGCDYRNVSKALTCLQNVTSEQLVNYTFPYVAAHEANTVMITKKVAFSPVVEKYNGENNFITQNYLDGHYSIINKADLLFGYTNYEGIIIVPFLTTLFSYYDPYEENYALTKVCDTLPLDQCLTMGRKVREKYIGNQTLDTNATKSFVNYVTDANFKYDNVKFYANLPTNGRKYMFQFSGESNRNEYGIQGVPYGIFGAAHMDTSPNCFDPKSRNLTLIKNSTEYQIIKRFTTVLKNFIFTGNPTPDSSLNVTAPEFNSITKHYLDIGTNNLTVSSLKNEFYYDFWSNLVESLGMKHEL